MSTNASEYFKSPNLALPRVNVPVYERVKQLHAFGYTTSQISETITQEFSDIDYNPYTPSALKAIITANYAEFEQARMELGLKCRDEIQTQIKLLFGKTRNVELTLVDVYVGKLEVALESLRGLDLEELDSEGNFKNTSRIFVLLELCEKLQSKVSKIVGTDALREIELIRAKAEIKRASEEKGVGLLPAFGAQDGDVEVLGTTWLNE